MRLFASIRAKIIWFVVIVLIIVLYFIIAQQITPYSSVAFVNNHVIEISPEVAGRIEKIIVANNQFAAKDQPLMVVEPQPYKLAVAKAQDNLVETTSEVAAMRLKLQQRLADLTKANAEFVRSQQNFNEISQLQKKGAVSLVRLQQATASLKAAQSILTQTKESVVIAKNQLGRDINGINVHIKSAQDKLALSKFYLYKTALRAPHDGFIENLNVHVGSYVSPGKTRIPFVTTGTWWVEAYFPENSMRKLKPGQMAYVRLDLFPGHLYKAKVVTVGHGISVEGLSANYSKYLPQFKPTDQWFRDMQVFPVGLEFVDLKDQNRLRVGGTAQVYVQTNRGWFWNSIAYLWLGLGSLFNYL